MSLCVALSLGVIAQEEGWHHGPADKDGSVGINTEAMYKQLQGRQSNTVVVAVIDSGMDIEHEDLKDNVWVNVDEIPDNGKDDDGNGYIDDVYGWNFIGGANGNVGPDTYEVTRLYGKYKYKYDGAIRSNLSKKEKVEYDLYIKCKEEVESKLERAENGYNRYTQSKANVDSGLDAIAAALDTNDVTLANLEAITPDGEAMTIGKNILLEQLANGLTVESIPALKDQIFQELDGGIEYFEGQSKYAYNPNFNTREIVGDNYDDQNEKYYGNNDVEGPDALHGTHVAGIIGAVRDNSIGMNGVADNVKLMSIRTVPDGDERDKDVANAIRYAVDNGASIINMSFGKGFSWYEKVVEDALKYAEKNDVLMVHAAGNSSQNNDTTDNFPNDTYKGKGFLFFKGKTKYYKNWVEVGALNFQNGEDLSAPFSNYGKENVDLFAPGMAIYATIPDDQYRPLQGTSMASPVVAGIAAVIRSYYPGLTAVQVKQILMSSSTKLNHLVKVPGMNGTTKSFSQLSVSGGTVNAEMAIKMAAQTPGKKKIKNTIKPKA